MKTPTNAKATKLKDLKPRKNPKGGDATTTTTGSQGSGSGAGKITFNPFSITRKIDVG